MKSRTNLLFLITDQQARGTLAAYGNNAIAMPHLNRLAGDSTVFKRAYCAQPVCGPARAALLTGTYPHINGQVTHNADYMRSEYPCLSSLLPADYRCAYFGHHVAPPPQDFVEFEEFSLPPAAYLIANGITPADGQRFTNEVDRPLIPEQHSGPAYLATRAEQFLGATGSDPFALFVSIYEPHAPWSGPLNHLYATGEMPLPANWSAVPGPDQPRRAWLEHLYLVEHGVESQGLATQDGWRRLIGNYWGLCTLVDRACGRILAALEELGRLEETLVIFTSDHGELIGAHQLLGKNMLFEESIGVPPHGAPARRRGSGGR